jgi:Ca-activated chloride channel family protein
VRVTADTVRTDVVLPAAVAALQSAVVTGAATERRAADRRSARRGVEAGAAVARKDAASADATAEFAPPPPPPPPAAREVMLRRVVPAPGAPAVGVAGGAAVGSGAGDVRRRGAPGDREQYDRVDDNPFLAVAGNPRSTFSLDVDRASYANVRRFLTAGRRPPADAVRIEELVNYFPYSAEAPRDGHALAVTTEVAPAPWRPAHRLVRVAVQARRAAAERKASNLVFLVDVSGSMMSPDKLPLVKQALGVLVDRLRPEDRVALVVYAGSAGLVLPSTPGDARDEIRGAIARLEAGGSTAGGAGLELAYQVARAHAGRASTRASCWPPTATSTSARRATARWSASSSATAPGART